jgi:O-antigen ligase
VTRFASLRNPIVSVLPWAAACVVYVAAGGLLATQSKVVTLGVVSIAGGMGLIACWAKRPDLVIGAFVFALPLLKDTSATGLANPDRIATAALLGVGVFSVLERPALPSQLRSIMRGLLVVAIAGLLSAIANHTVGIDNVAKLLFKPLSWAMILWLVATHFETAEKAALLVRTLIFSAAVVSLVALWQKATGHMTASFSEGVPRATGTFETWNELGGFMALMIAPTIAYSLACRNRLFMVIAGAEVVSLLLSQTLGAFVAIVVASVFVLPLRRLPVSGRLTLAVVPLVGALALSIAAPGTLAKAHQVGARTQDRLATYAAGWHVARRHPWFGTGSVQAAASDIRAGAGATQFGYTTSVPHNAFISTLVERGLLGAVALLYIAWISLRILVRSGGRGRLLEAGVMLGGVAFLIQSNTNNLLNNERLGLIFLVLVFAASRMGTRGEAQPGILTPRGPEG